MISPFELRLRIHQAIKSLECPTSDKEAQQYINAAISNLEVAHRIIRGQHDRTQHRTRRNKRSDYF